MKYTEMGYYGARPRQVPLRWMLFVDGENLTIQGQAVAKHFGIQLIENAFYRRSAYLWCHRPGNECAVPLPLEADAVRAYYYTSTTGDSGATKDVEEKLWAFKFTGRVFHKEKGRARKRVDIMLARDVLVHAFRDHYDVAFLIAGDEDYVPLVEEVRAHGKRTYVGFFSKREWGMSDELRLAADEFINMDSFFCDSWMCTVRDFHQPAGCNGRPEVWGIDIDALRGQGLGESEISTCRGAAHIARQRASQTDRRANLCAITFRPSKSHDHVVVDVASGAPGDPASPLPIKPADKLIDGIQAQIAAFCKGL